MILVLQVLALAPLRVSKRHVSNTVKMTDTVTTVMDDDDSLTLAQLRARLLPAWHALRALAEERSLTTRLDCSVGEWASRTLLATRLVRRCPAEGRPRPATHTRPCRGQERLPLDRCHVAESTIAAAGNGVFASRNISEGELITLYPGDGLRIEAGTEGAEGAKGAEGADPALVGGLWLVAGTDGSCRGTDASILERGKDYEREVDREAEASPSLIGDPHLVGDPAYLGHMINDGATCTREALRTAYLAEVSK